MKTREATKKTEGGHRPGNAVDPLDTMKISELQLKFAEVVGEPTRSPNKVFLLRRIKEAIAAKAAAVEAAAPLPDQLAATGDSSDTGEYTKPETLATPSSEEMPAGVSPEAHSVALNSAPASPAPAPECRSADTPRTPFPRTGGSPPSSSAFRRNCGQYASTTWYSTLSSGLRRA